MWWRKEGKGERWKGREGTYEIDEGGVEVG
jgi:hypothetical protein